MDDKQGRKRQFAAVIVQARIARDMTQAALAKAVGCNVRLVRLWEAGESLPGWEFLRKLCLTLGLSGDQLLLLERVHDVDSLPPLAWESARQELFETDRVMREALHHLGQAANILGRPPASSERTNGTGASRAALRREDRARKTSRSEVR